MQQWMPPAQAAGMQSRLRSGLLELGAFFKEGSRLVARGLNSRALTSKW